MDPKEKYKPPLAFHSLTAWYDPVMQWTMRETTFKPALVRQARIRPGHTVLDLGCGTATLTILMKSMYPDAQVLGLDGDAQTLQIAGDKVKQSGLEISFTQALSYALPYDDASLDGVLSSLLLHHLSTQAKLQTMAEVYRVLRPGGQFHIADWGRPATPLARGLFYLVQLLDGFDVTADNVAGRIPHMLMQCGFEGVEETDRFSTIFGTLSLYQARKPI